MVGRGALAAQLGNYPLRAQRPLHAKARDGETKQIRTMITAEAVGDPGKSQTRKK